MMEMDLEAEWTAELGEPVEILHIPFWDEYDIYIDGVFVVTVPNLERAEFWLAKYAAVRDEVDA